MEKLNSNLFMRLKKEKAKNKFLLFLDNIKIICDAINSQTIKPLLILVANEDTTKKLNLFKVRFENSGEQDFDKILKNSNTNSLPIFKSTISQIDSLCDVKTSQKVVCVALFRKNIVPNFDSNFLVLDGLQDAGNVGSLIRTAKACGFDNIYLLSCVHKSNSKVVRSSVGAVFLTNVFEMSRDEFLNIFKRYGNNATLLKCDMSGENIFNYKASSVVGVVIGNEGQGVSEQIGAICSKSIKIPMKSGIESLNASVSGAIIMYQINKDIL